MTCSAFYPPANFNPRSREGSDTSPIRANQNKKISIHAPARGATAAYETTMQEISDFNPRSRGGSDDILAFFDVTLYISIHAPARGATMTHLEGKPYRQNFNPRSREGSDMMMFALSHAPRFQSTLPRGERHWEMDTVVSGQDFNPRSREGSD